MHLGQSSIVRHAKYRAAQPALGIAVLLCLAQSFGQGAPTAQPELERITESYRQHYQTLGSLRVVYEETPVPLIDRSVLWQYERRHEFVSEAITVVMHGGTIHYDFTMERKDLSEVFRLLAKESPNRFKGVQGDLNQLVSYAEIERLLPEVKAKSWNDTFVFDGSSLRYKSPATLREADTEIPTFAILDASKDTFSTFWWVYPELVLYAPLTPRLPKYEDHAQESRIPELFSRAGASVSVGHETFKRIDCTVVKVGGRQKLWLDDRYGYAVRRREVSYEGRPWTELEYEDLVEVASGVWLPKTLTKTDFGGKNLPKEYQGKPYLKTAIRVKALEANDPKDVAFFTLNPSPGTVVFDKRLRPVDSQDQPIDKPLREGLIPCVSYVQPAKEADLEKVVQQAQREQGETIENREPARRGWRGTLFVCLNVTFVAAVVAFLLFRWLRAARTAHT